MALASTLALAAIGALGQPVSVAAEEAVTPLEVTGRVTDSNGKTLAGMAVRLKAAHSTVSLRRMSRVEAHPTFVTVTTDERGDYHLTWQRHEFYDRLALEIGLKVSSGEGFLEVQSQDISDRISEPGPLVVPLVVEATPRIDGYQAFVATLATEDQWRIFEQMGRPEKADSLQVAGQEEVTWWYFRRGKAYRFEGGRLDLVIPFEPVGN